MQEVSIGRRVLSLPVLVDGLIIDRQTDILAVQGYNGLDVQCNLMFHTCKLQVSGMYGKNNIYISSLVVLR